MMFGGLFAACSDFLDKDPTTLTLEDYFNTEEEANSFLTGIYAILGQTSFYGANYMYLAAGDDLAHYGGSGRSPASMGLICNNATISDQAVTAFWYTLYSGINRANLFLENIDRVSDIDDDTKAQYIAEVRFLRAFYYFNLVQCWGDVPFKTTSTDDVSGLAIERTDKQEIYDFIVSEMAEVSDVDSGGLLTAAELSYLPGHVSKSAAWGILARVYLFRAGEHYRDGVEANEDETTTYFEEAKKYAQMVVDNGGHSLADDYWDVFIDLCSDQYNTTAKESIWEAEFAGNNTSDTRSEGRIGNIIGLVAPDLSNESDVTGSADPGYSYGFIYSTPKLYRLYCLDVDSVGYDPTMSIDELMAMQVNYASGTTVAKDEAWRLAQIKRADWRFMWNIAPFTYVESGGSNTGVTGRRFYEGTYYRSSVQQGEGFAEIWRNHDDGRSYSYGDTITIWENGADEPEVGDYDYTSGNNHFTTNIARVCAKFRREYEADKKDKNYTSINFPILRYADVLLMLAEAENEVNGPTEDAYYYLNLVRKRAIKYDDGTDGEVTRRDFSKDQFRQLVKDERGRELCFEYLRRFDLIRWGEFTERMNELVIYARSGGEWNQGPTNVYTYFQVSDTYNYFPIPDAELSVNTAITENNPGW